MLMAVLLVMQLYLLANHRLNDQQVSSVLSLGETFFKMENKLSAISLYMESLSLDTNYPI